MQVRILRHAHHLVFAKMRQQRRKSDVCVFISVDASREMCNLCSTRGKNVQFHSVEYGRQAGRLSENVEFFVGERLIRVRRHPTQAVRWVRMYKTRKILKSTLSYKATGFSFANNSGYNCNAAHIGRLLGYRLPHAPFLISPHFGHKFFDKPPFAKTPKPSKIP